MIRTEGPPVRVKGVPEQPVTIAPVRECTCSAGDPLKVWRDSLGCTPKFETLRRGSSTSFSHAGLQLQVLTARLTGSTADWQHG